MQGLNFTTNKSDVNKEAKLNAVETFIIKHLIIDVPKKHEHSMKGKGDKRHNLRGKHAMILNGI